MTKKTTKPRRAAKLSVDKDLLKFFPKPSRIGLPTTTHWEKLSTAKPCPREKQTVRNSY